MQDLDPVETQEWLDALESVLDKEGEDRAHYLMTRMGELATRSGSQLPYAITTPYRNTIPRDPRSTHAWRPVHGTPHSLAGTLERDGHGNAYEPERF